MIKQQNCQNWKRTEVIKFNPESSVISHKLQRAEAFKHSLNSRRTSLSVQWLEFGVFTAMAPSSIPGRGTKILQTAECSQKKARNTLLFMESQKKIQFVDLHISSSNTQSKKNLCRNETDLPFDQYLKYYTDSFKESLRILREMLYKILLLYF